MTPIRIAILGLFATAFVAGFAIYYLQVYAYYDEVTVEDVGEVQLTLVEFGTPAPILFENFKAIDSNSSPIRFRSCFETPLSQDMLQETYEVLEDAAPLVAPSWFDCFDAREIGEALESGEAIAFMGVENITFGIDRVVAIMPDGRGFSWHQINICGENVFDGNPAPEGCPPVPERGE
ncbi:MAG: histidine kinase [Thalassobium sp.]|nr:MAG: histidine kinase [Thalassobium sp.]